MRAAVLLLGLAAAGCEGSTARRFAVTVLEESDVDCRAEVHDEALDQDKLDAQAAALRKEYRTAKLLDPPTPVGRLLRVNQVEERMSAWFDAYADSPTPGLWPGTVTPYDDPATVYRGDVHDGYVEGSYLEVANTDAQDEADGRELCGDRPRVRGVLALTDGDSIQGRVRWTDYVYLPSNTSACAATIHCARDFVIEGVEE